MNLSAELKKLFDRDLERLENELDLYKDDEHLWIVKNEIKNSAGNLILHICGNLQHFIGAVLEKINYERDRTFEFEGKTSIKELTENVKIAREILSTYFDRATMDDMADPYPKQVFGYPMTKSEFLIHLYGHLNYHLGQINYHRRLIDRAC